MRVFLSGWTIPENSKYLISSTDLHIIRCTITLINSCQQLSLTTKGKKLLVRVFDLSAEYFNSRTDIRAYLRAKWGLLCLLSVRYLSQRTTFENWGISPNFYWGIQ